MNPVNLNQQPSELQQPPLEPQQQPLPQQPSELQQPPLEPQQQHKQPLFQDLTQVKKQAQNSQKPQIKDPGLEYKHLKLKSFLLLFASLITLIISVFMFLKTRSVETPGINFAYALLFLIFSILSFILGIYFIKKNKSFNEFVNQQTNN